MQKTQHAPGKTPGKAQEQPLYEIRSDWKFFCPARLHQWKHSKHKIRPVRAITCGTFSLVLGLSVLILFSSSLWALALFCFLLSLPFFGYGLFWLNRLRFMARNSYFRMTDKRCYYSVWRDDHPFSRFRASVNFEQVVRFDIKTDDVETVFNWLSFARVNIATIIIILTGREAYLPFVWQPDTVVLNGNQLLTQQKQKSQQADDDITTKINKGIIPP
jgi:hypothetical protein